MANNHHHHEECVTQENTSIHNWWNDLHACSLSSWSTTSCSSSNTCWQTNNHGDQSKTNINLSDDHLSNSSGDENLSISTTSFTNVSNHSDLSAESAGNDQFVGETVVGSSDHQNQLWNHLLLNAGCREEIQNQDSAGGIFNPTCENNDNINNNNYSTLLPSFNAVKNHHPHPHHHQQQFNLLGDTPIIIDNPKEQIIKSSDMAVEDVDVDVINNINNWQRIPHHDSTTTSSLIGNDFFPRSSNHDDQNMMMTMMMMRNSFGQEEDEQAHVTLGNNNNIIDQYSRTHRSLAPYAGGGLFPAVPTNVVNSRSFSSTDFMAANNQVAQNSRPLMLDINLSKPFLKTQMDLSSSARCRKQGFRNSRFSSPTSMAAKSATKRNGRTQGNDHQIGRKGSSLEDNSESLSKKPKQETSSAAVSSSSSTKMQVPKVKLGDKITALQQIVSPFGKTDTASVLWEAIGYIRFLQEQIQLLSTPYMKGCASKEIWGGLERREMRGEGKVDLRSRGLCLVPISCTPQVYPDNFGSDYLTPVYRGCLYR